jgi:hypothetical protein
MNTSHTEPNPAKVINRLIIVGNGFDIAHGFEFIFFLNINDHLEYY